MLERGSLCGGGVGGARQRRSPSLLLSGPRQVRSRQNAGRCASGVLFDAAGNVAANVLARKRLLGRWLTGDGQQVGVDADGTPDLLSSVLRCGACFPRDQASVGGRDGNSARCVGRNTKQPDKRIKRSRGVIASRRATEQLGSTAEQVAVVGVECRTNEVRC